MKNLLLYLMLLGLFQGFYSCQSTFLQVPDVTGETDLKTVYSNSVNAFSALTQSYSNTLVMGLATTNSNGRTIPYTTNANANLGNLTDELGWGPTYYAYHTLPVYGFDANGTHTDDNYVRDYMSIRENWLVAENIDKVPDMSTVDKATVKAEIDGLNAYTYMGMFYRYGGVPIVTKSFNPNDNLTVPRSSLDSTFQYILTLCNKAIAGLPISWPANMTGRLTKGAVMAMKARLWMYAARPLFNSATPYLNNGSHNNLICFGNVNPARWDSAIVANQAVLNWANQNGYGIINTGNAGEGQPNPNAFDDYGTATSTPGNPEVLLAYKDDDPGKTPSNFNFSSTNAGGKQPNVRNIGTLYTFFKNYYNADGTDPSSSWPQVGDPARPASDYLARTKALEPRFHDDQLGPGFDPTYMSPNPGVSKWSINGWVYALMNASTSPVGVIAGYGCSVPIKFFYHNIGNWFEMPLFRMAEIYLNLAEAYNEAPDRDVTLALQYLNVVHNRAGLPAITETDQTKLRAIIQREWAIEFFEEGQRLFQVKHWELANIDTQILGGPVMEFEFQVLKLNGNVNLAPNLVNYRTVVTYSKFWSPKMFLDPIPQTEINKGVAVQNPGY